MLCFVAIGYINWLIDTVVRLAFNSRTVIGKKLLWYTDVSAYIARGSPHAAALVVGMFVGLVFIKSSYALINELWFFSFAKSLSRREYLVVFPRLAAKVSRFNLSSADVMLPLLLSLEINLTALCCTISMSFVIYYLIQVGVPDSSSVFHMWSA